MWVTPRKMFLSTGHVTVGPSRGHATEGEPLAPQRLAKHSGWCQHPIRCVWHPIPKHPKSRETSRGLGLTSSLLAGTAAPAQTALARGLRFLLLFFLAGENGWGFVLAFMFI